jgi:cell division protein FtsN
MTHDFAKKKKPPAKKKRAAKKSQVPGWVWLFTGIVTGVFICFLGYLADIVPEPAPEPTNKAVAKPSKKSADKPSGTKFDFYTLLPEREVIVPDEPKADSAAPTEATIYILQAGSFRSAEDADRLRARLILMGLDARVDAVTNSNGDQWHRVQVGPFSDRSRLAKARSTLISEGIDTLLMKKKAG